jgi:hypothetical protein
VPLEIRHIVYANLLPPVSTPKPYPIPHSHHGSSTTLMGTSSALYDEMFLLVHERSELIAYTSDTDLRIGNMGVDLFDDLNIHTRLYKLDMREFVIFVVISPEDTDTVVKDAATEMKDVIYALSKASCIRKLTILLNAEHELPPATFDPVPLLEKYVQIIIKIEKLHKVQ